MRGLLLGLLLALVLVLGFVPSGAALSASETEAELNSQLELMYPSGEDEETETKAADDEDDDDDDDESDDDDDDDDDDELLAESADDHVLSDAALDELLSVDDGESDTELEGEGDADDDDDASVEARKCRRRHPRNPLKWRRCGRRRWHKFSRRHRWVRRVVKRNGRWWKSKRSNKYWRNGQWVMSTRTVNHPRNPLLYRLGGRWVQRPRTRRNSRYVRIHGIWFRCRKMRFAWKNGQWVDFLPFRRAFMQRFGIKRTWRRRKMCKKRRAMLRRQRMRHPNGWRAFITPRTSVARPSLFGNAQEGKNKKKRYISPDMMGGLSKARRTTLMKKAIRRVSNVEFRRMIDYFLKNYNTGAPELTTGIKREARPQVDKAPWNQVAIGLENTLTSDDYNPEPGHSFEEPTVNEADGTVALQTARSWDNSVPVFDSRAPSLSNVN